MRQRNICAYTSAMSKPNPRPNLTETEWRRVKVKAAQLGVTISEFTAAALRAAVKGGAAK